jgi:hypothetical protein
MLLPPLSKLVWNPCSDMGPVEVTNTGMVESLMLDNQTVVTPRMAEPNVCIFSAEKVNLKRA